MLFFGVIASYGVLLAATSDLTFEASEEFCKQCSHKGKEVFTLGKAKSDRAAVDFEHSQTILMAESGKELLGFNGVAGKGAVTAFRQSLKEKALEDSPWTFDPASGTIAYLRKTLFLRKTVVAVENSNLGKGVTITTTAKSAFEPDENPMLALRIYRNFLYIIGLKAVEVWNYAPEDKVPRLAFSGPIKSTLLGGMYLAPNFVDIIPIDVATQHSEKNNDGKAKPLTIKFNQGDAFKLAIASYNISAHKVEVSQVLLCSGDQCKKVVNSYTKSDSQLVEDLNRKEYYHLDENQVVDRITISRDGKVFVLVHGKEGESAKSHTVLKLKTTIGEFGRERALSEGHGGSIPLLTNFIPI